MMTVILVTVKESQRVKESKSQREYGRNMVIKIIHNLSHLRVGGVVM